MSRWTRIGLIGTLVTALCCFTPLLVWPLAAIGLSALVGYLDYLLFPLLGFFILVLLFGIVRGAIKGRR